MQRIQTGAEEMHYSRYILGIVVLLLGVFSVWAIGEDPGTPTNPNPNLTSGNFTAPVVNNEGGTTLIRGILSITNTNVISSTNDPVVILEDQLNFITKDFKAPIPQESQVLAIFLDDFYSNEETRFEIVLPAVPRGTFNDVDGNTSTDPGVQIYQVAFWDNRYGDLYLDERDAYGWSGAYNSVTVNNDPRQYGEITGGKLMVYAGQEGQGFPLNFGDDELLFTGDEEIVTLPIGWTLIDLDTDPFTFDRSSEVTVDLIEPEGAQFDDFSDLSYTEAFDALIEKARNEYVFTEYKDIDWDDLYDEFYPLFEEAEQDNDVQAYYDAIDAFAMSIPDGHVAAYGSSSLADNRRDLIQGGIGLAVRELSDGRILVAYLTENGESENAGIELGAEILEVNGEPVDDYLDTIVPFTGPFSNEEQLRIAQVVFGFRFELGDRVEITYQNPGDRNDDTARLDTVQEFDDIDWNYNIVYGDGSGSFTPENPVEFRFTEDGVGIVEVNTFGGNEALIVANWNYFLNTANANGAPGIIIDLRTNSGGFSSIGHRLASTLYEERFKLYDSEGYNEEIDDFWMSPFYSEIFPDPLAPYYDGEVVVLVGPGCASACEFFAYSLTRQDRSVVIGQYGSYAIGGGWVPTFMPEGVEFALPTDRDLDENGEIVVEGTGIQPDIRIEVTEDNMNTTNDVVLEAAIEHLLGR
jgi:C-terminal processing protease CtpA/Prc